MIPVSPYCKNLLLITCVDSSFFVMPLKWEKRLIWTIKIWELGAIVRVRTEGQGFRHFVHWKSGRVSVVDFWRVYVWGRENA